MKYPYIQEWIIKDNNILYPKRLVKIYEKFYMGEGAASLFLLVQRRGLVGLTP